MAASEHRQAARRTAAAAAALVAAAVAGLLVAILVPSNGSGGRTAAVPKGAVWSSTFQDRNPWARWEGYREPLQSMQGGIEPGQLTVVEPRSVGIPPPPGYGDDTKILRARVSAPEFLRYSSNYPNSYCCVQAKLYHGWGGSQPGDGPPLKPGQESGSYRAWYYLPPDTPTFAATNTSVHWVNIMQWKTVAAGTGAQSVVAEADLLPVGDRVWLCLGYGWAECYPPTSANAVAVGLGHWFELRADFHHGRGIEWFLDGRHVWSTLGPRASGLEPGQGWVFGIGHYGGIGTLYAKNASFTPFH